MEQYKTRYCGIYVQEDHGYYWIVDDFGCERHFGKKLPTSDDVEAYRADAINRPIDRETLYAIRS